ncbi:MAG: nucleotide exchange factor GrpE [Clostridium sp.]|nr:nucleotide exchange factor GrpE [Clostridium sp.]MBQ5421621.1 nucleotide exchange factor GrpE [Clostridium sp.]
MDNTKEREQNTAEETSEVLKTEEAAEENREETKAPEGAGTETAAEEAEGETAAEEAAEEEKEKETAKELFHHEKKDPKDEKIAELTDRMQRTMAEFDNFRKRTEKEKAAMYEIGAKDIIEKILPVLDNFERGLTTVPEEEKENPFVQGMDKIYKQFVKTLEDIGVKPMDAAGKPFDPNFHNAVMHVEDEELGENIVAEELQKGYTYRDSVVRPAMVKVAN